MYRFIGEMGVTMSWIFYLLVAALIVYEGITLTNKYDGDTISEIIWHLSNRPLVPFIFGMLMGHFFWQMEK